MTTFDQRENAFESQFVQDETIRFKALARRNRQLGIWAAALLGKSGVDAEAYAADVVTAGVNDVADQRVFGKLRADFDAAGVVESDHQIHRTMNELLTQAIEQIKSEG